MNKLLSKFTPADVIALIVICGGFALKFMGENGTISTLLTMIVGFYFGKRGLYDSFAHSGGGPCSATAIADAKIR